LKSDLDTKVQDISTLNDQVKELQHLRQESETIFYDLNNQYHEGSATTIGLKLELDIKVQEINTLNDQVKELQHLKQ